MSVTEEDLELIRREMNARFDRVHERFNALERKMDKRFDDAGAQMERIIALLSGGRQ